MGPNMQASGVFVQGLPEVQHGTQLYLLRGPEVRLPTYPFRQHQTANSCSMTELNLGIETILWAKLSDAAYKIVLD